MKFTLAVLALTGIVCIAPGFSAQSDSGLKNKDIQRKIDLTSSLVKISSQVTLENAGTKPVSSMLFAAENIEGGVLASLKATAKVGGEQKELALDVVAGKISLFEVVLPSSLSAGSTVALSFQSVFTHGLRPFPAEIKQAENQLVKFLGSLYYPSPYVTASQKTVVSLASAKVESYTKTKPVAKAESSITYGPYENKEADAQGELAVHFENNTPFLAVTSMKRLIEVSHWGNIAVEETIDIRHTGAKLKGPFSRYDYQRQQSPGSSVKSFKTVLPASAADVYYRDDIGNISTSNMKVMMDAVEVELRPRFPLFGGWKTHYILGYNVPSYQYLWTDGSSNYALNMPFLDHVFDNQVVDEITVEIILPEGSSVEDVNVPFTYTRGDDRTIYTYLDTVGRPVIVLKNKNLVEEHIKEFTLKYTFNKTLLIREPILVVAFLFAIFFLVIIYVRLDFAISKDDASESKLKISSYVEAAHDVLDKRAAVYQSYNDALTKYKDVKDLTAYQSQRKTIDSNHKRLNKEFEEVTDKLKTEPATEQLVDRFNELQKLDKQYIETVDESQGKAERVVGGKLKKDDYVKQEESLQAKRDQLMERIGTVSAQL